MCSAHALQGPLSSAGVGWACSQPSLRDGGLWGPRKTGTGEASPRRRSGRGQDHVPSPSPHIAKLTCTRGLLPALRGSLEPACPFLGSACNNAIKDGKALFSSNLLRIKPQD